MQRSEIEEHVAFRQSRTTIPDCAALHPGDWLHTQHTFAPFKRCHFARREKSAFHRLKETADFALRSN